MKNFQPVSGKSETTRQQFNSGIINTKPVIVESYTNWSIPSKPADFMKQGIKEIKEKAPVMMDPISGHLLLLFLMNAV